MARQWAMVLHFYQPPVQDLGVTKQVLESSYLPVMRLLAGQPQSRMTFNISACLLEQLAKMQKDEFFVLLRRLVQSGQAELLSGPAYHPIAPLMYKDLFVRQMERTKKIYTDTLGILPGEGVFLPELAVSPEVIRWLGELGMKYTVVDESAVAGFSKAQAHGIVCFANNRLVTEVIRAYPHRLQADKLVAWVQRLSGDEVVSVNDVEAFGHHYQERLEVLELLLQSPEFQFVTLGELRRVGVPEAEIVPSSWQVGEGPFWLWDNPENPLQQLYKRLADTAAQALAEGKSQTHPEALGHAELHLDKGLSSCYLYWLSNWPWWHPELVERGAQQLVKCVRTVEVSVTLKQQAEELYHQFLGELWKRHWSGEVEKHYRAYEAARLRGLLQLPDLG